MDNPIQFCHVIIQREHGNEYVNIISRNDVLTQKDFSLHNICTCTDEFITREATIAYTTTHAAVAICDPIRSDKETNHIDMFEKSRGRAFARVRLENMLNAHAKAAESHLMSVAQPKFHDFPRKRTSEAVNTFLTKLRAEQANPRKKVKVVS